MKIIQCDCTLCNKEWINGDQAYSDALKEEEGKNQTIYVAKPRRLRKQARSASNNRPGVSSAGLTFPAPSTPPFRPGTLLSHRARGTSLTLPDRDVAIPSLLSALRLALLDPDFNSTSTTERSCSWSAVYFSAGSFDDVTVIGRMVIVVAVATGWRLCLSCKRQRF